MHIINEKAPHFITGTESWLNSSVFSNEVFPNNYHIFRKDILECYIMQFKLIFYHIFTHPPQLHVATIKDSSLFLPGSTATTTHFCHQPSESGTPSLSKLLLLKMLMTFRLNYTHAHLHTHN